MNYSLLIKPASYNCNLRCAYCFYWCKSKLFGPHECRMSRKTLETLIGKYYQLDLPEYSFAWQGGEPTLMGLDFYGEAVRLQRQMLPQGKKVSNALQTNGTMLDRSWAKFLKRHHFLTGVSLDGPRRLHDRYRFKVGGGGSYEDVVRGIGCLRKEGADYNLLTLVSEANVRYPGEVYHHLLEQGGFYQQYIECLEFGEGDDYRPYSLKPGQFGEFLCKIFDLWYPRDCGRVSIRHFDSVLSRLLTGRATTCPMGGDCRNYLVVEYNGDLYPCDFYVTPELRLGNVCENSLEEVIGSQCYESFGRGKEPRSAECMGCRFLALCMGDCQKHRRGKVKSRLCEDWKLFYSHTIERFELLADAIQAGQFG